MYLLVLVPFVGLRKLELLAALPFVGGPFEAAATLWNLPTLDLLWVGLSRVAGTCGLDLGASDHVVGLWALLDAVVHASSLLQPGLWGNPVLVGLPAYRLAERRAAVAERDRPRRRPAGARDAPDRSPPGPD